MNTQPIITVDKVCKRYGAKTILDGLSFEVLRGECFVIMGRSGSGKSVTLRQINGLEKPDSGRVIFDGVEISALEERQLYETRKRIAMLFQGGALFDSMTVFENIAFPMRQHTEWNEEQIGRRVSDRLSRVRLEAVEEKMPSALSGGMRKRVALARSLALEPDVVLFDEPTTGLDPMTSASIGHLIRSIQSEMGVTAIVVTHDLALARRVGDRIAFLQDGRFSFQGNWEEADRTDNSLLAAFLAGREEDT